MSPLQLKNQLASFVSQFDDETCNFQKCVIIHDYMDFVNKTNPLYKYIEKSVNALPTQLAVALNNDRAIYEAEYFETDLEFVDNDWVYYIFLNNIYEALKYFKHAPDFRKTELKTNIEKSFSKKHSNQIFKIALDVFNDKLNGQINQSGFMDGNKANFVNDNSKIIYSYNEASQIGVLEILENRIQFEKDRALIVDFFFKSKTLENGENLKTYRDYNKKYSTKIDSNMFRQNIIDINKRIMNESDGLVNQIIETESKDNPTQINRYKWLITV